MDMWYRRRPETVSRLFNRYRLGDKKRQLSALLKMYRIGRNGGLTLSPSTSNPPTATSVHLYTDMLGLFSWNKFLQFLRGAASSRQPSLVPFPRPRQILTGRV